MLPQSLGEGKLQADHALALKASSWKWHANSHTSLARGSHMATTNFPMRQERKCKYLYIYICIIKSRKKGRRTPPMVRNPTARLEKFFGTHELRTGYWKVEGTWIYGKEVMNWNTEKKNSFQKFWSGGSF